MFRKSQRADFLSFYGEPSREKPGKTNLLEI